MSTMVTVQQDWKEFIADCKHNTYGLSEYHDGFCLKAVCECSQQNCPRKVVNASKSAVRSAATKGVLADARIENNIRAMNGLGMLDERSLSFMAQPDSFAMPVAYAAVAPEIDTVFDRAQTMPPTPKSPVSLIHFFKQRVIDYSKEYDEAYASELELILGIDDDEYMNFWPEYQDDEIDVCGVQILNFDEDSMIVIFPYNNPKLMGTITMDGKDKVAIRDLKPTSGKGFKKMNLEDIMKKLFGTAKSRWPKSVKEMELCD